MKFNTIFVFIILLISISCSENEQVLKGIKSIHLKGTNDILPISSFVKSIDYLELKFPTNNTYNGEIEGVKIIGNELILTQRKGSESNFLRFSKDGNFKNELTHKNLAAKEITKPKDIIQFNSDYALWGESGIHVISKAGKYKNKLFDTTLPGNRFFYSKNKMFLFHESTPPGFLGKYNTNGSQEKIFSPSSKQTTHLGYSTVSIMGKDNFHLFSPLNDTVFAFNQISLSPKYFVSAHPYPTLMQILINAGDKDEKEILKFINNKKYVVVKNYLENKNYIFITYWVGSKSINLVIEKRNWETTYFALCVNDIDGGIWGNPVYLSDDDELYIPLSSYKITGHKIVNEKRKDFNLIKEKIGKSGNPVLLRCKLK